MRRLHASVFIVLAACLSSLRDPSRPFVGELPKDAHLDLAGRFTLSARGELRLALAHPCTDYRDNRIGGMIIELCSRAVLDEIVVLARAPWGQEVRGTWSGPAFIDFSIDWKTTGIDPLADGAAVLVARPWSISGTQWEPQPNEVDRMLAFIGAATETETDVVRGGPPPRLEVTSFEIEGNVLHPGDPNTLVVRIANHGSGAAYRVVATTRSSIDGLHGKRLPFGTIRPGAEKVRALKLTLPISETARDTMLVIALSEANDAVPRNASRRIPISPSVAPLALAVRCVVEGRDAVRPDVDSGERLPLVCVARNHGDTDLKQLEFEVSVSGGPAIRTAPRSIAAGNESMFNVQIDVPRSLPIDAPVQITITARDRSSSRIMSSTLVGVVRKPKLCVPGHLTRAQYHAKVEELRAAVAAGDLTQAAFDRFDADLVSCLK